MRKYLAELIGTFALVFCGTGAIIVNEHSGSLLTIAFAFGFTIMAMIYAIGHVSGAHLNPAVTIAFALSGRFKVNLVVPYIISQFAGAFIASLVLKYLFPENTGLGATTPSGEIMQSLILEFIATFILMLIIINVATGSKEQGMFAGLAIGSTIILDILFAGPISGASMNPARTLAPAVVSGHMNDLWIYFAGPIAGAAFAIPVWKYLNTDRAKQDANTAV